MNEENECFDLLPRPPPADPTKPRGTLLRTCVWVHFMPSRLSARFTKCASSCPAELASYTRCLLRTGDAPDRNSCAQEWKQVQNCLRRALKKTSK
jgi:hypothetical protein